MTLREEWIEDDHQTMAKSDTIGHAYGWLRGENPRPPIVLDGKRPYAVINPRPFLDKRVDEGTRVDKVAQPVPVLKPGAPDTEIVGRFRETLVPYLPVGDADTLHGYVTALRVLEEVFEVGPTAGEAAQNVPVLGFDDSLEQAAHAFTQTRVRHLPVMDRGGRLVGAMARSQVVLAQDNADQSQGRKDRVGVRDDIWAEPVQGYMEEGWDEVDETMRFSQLLDRLKDQDTVFVRGRDGLFRGVLDAPLLLRAAAEADDRFTVGRERHPPTPAARHR